MSETTTYHVLREHLGDRDYVRGETRELRPNEAEHLVKLGVLAEAKPSARTESKPEAKAEKTNTAAKAKSKAKGKA